MGVRQERGACDPVPTRFLGLGSRGCPAEVVDASRVVESAGRTREWGGWAARMAESRRCWWLTAWAAVEGTARDGRGWRGNGLWTV